MTTLKIPVSPDRSGPAKMRSRHFRLPLSPKPRDLAQCAIELPLLALLRVLVRRARPRLGQEVELPLD
jgi:hypothetical protein